MDIVFIGIFWLAALAAFIMGPKALLYLFFVGIPFGSFAVLPSAVTGGLTLTPLPIAALLIVIRTMLRADPLSRLIRHAFSANPVAILMAFWAVAIVTTAFMPRVFAGNIYIVPVRVVEGGVAPLYPSTQNFSQLAYLSLSIMTVFAFRELLRREELRSTMIKALTVGAVVTVATGVLDYASQFLPIDGIMSALRTANYALLVDAEVLGEKRIVGLMPEASSFGSVCVTMFAMVYFLRRAAEPGSALSRIMLLLLPVLVGFVYVSTSSAAYFGLAVAGVLIVLEWVYRFFTLPASSGGRKVLSRELTVAVAGSIAVVALLLFVPAIFDRLVNLFNALLLEKTDTESFTERAMWTRVAWQSVVDTYGLGVGVGSARASNFWAALMSNTGVLGALLYWTFAFSCYLQRPAHDTWSNRFLLSGCRWSLVPLMAIGTVVGTSTDFGLPTAFIYGLMLGTGMPTAERGDRRLSASRLEPA